MTKQIFQLSEAEEEKILANTYVCSYCKTTVYPYYLEQSIMGKIYVISRMCTCQQRYIAKCEENTKLQRQKESLQRNSATAMVSERFKSCTFETWKRNKETDVMYLEVESLVNNYDRRRASADGLILCGPPSVGKTHLLAAAVNALLKKNKRALFVNVPEFLKKIRATYNRKSVDSEDEVMRRLLLADTVVLDDLGAERNTESGWVEETLYVLINGMYMKKTLALVSTNHSMETLEPQIGERSYERLIEMCRIVECDAPSYRQVIAQNRAHLFNQKWHEVEYTEADAAIGGL